jgi:hypothetical protein
MNNKTKAHREFALMYVTDDLDLKQLCAFELKKPIDFVCEAHVIEYSRVEELEKEIDRLNKMLEYERQREFPTQSQREMEIAIKLSELTQQNEKLLDTINKMKTAMESALNESNRAKQNGCVITNVCLKEYLRPVLDLVTCKATEALKEVEWK